MSENPEPADLPVQPNPNNITENEPLITNKNNETLPKQSGRTLGTIQSRSTKPKYGSTQEFLTAETCFQRMIIEIQTEYRTFISNSKWVIHLLLIINTIWLVISLISDYFLSIGVFLRTHNRLNSFNDIALITVSIIINLLNLWFTRLGVYSALDTTLNVILCAITLFNLFLLYLVKFTRKRIGLMGTATYLWASFSFFIGVILDVYVHKYNCRLKESLNKHYNDINDEPIASIPSDIANENALNLNTANISENKHTFKEWIYIFIRTAVKFMILLYIVMFTLNTMLGAWDLHRTTRDSNSSVNIEKASYDNFHWIDEYHTYQLHIQCYGDIFNFTNKDMNIEDEYAPENHPIILYEHGAYDTGYHSADWIQELYHLNKIHRYCTYERPGYGFSDSAPAPISMSMIADGLKYALVNDANITGPFVTVGYDMGGLLTQIFTAKNLDRVKGMMLVESWHKELLLKNYIQRLLPPDHGDDDDDDDHRYSYDDYFISEIEKFDSLPYTSKESIRRGRNNKDRLPPEIKRLNELKFMWDGIWSPIDIRLQTSWLVAHHGSNERVFGRDMKFQGRFLRNKFLEAITSSLLSYRDVSNSEVNLKNIRTSIVSSKEMAKKSSKWGEWQRELSKLSHNTREWKLVEGGHEIYKFGVGVQQTQEVLIRLLRN